MPPKRKKASELTTSKPTLKLSSNKKGADYRPLFFYLKIKMTNIFNQIYLIDFQNIYIKLGNLWNFISQLLTQDILAFDEHFADILVQDCGGLVFVGSEFGSD